jgi:hypothetical protein
VAAMVAGVILAALTLLLEFDAPAIK